ncbi:hypothetical protein CWE12_01090 [Aliidiomarina sedimenti]|uniref:FMN-binding negative transcriptional regulator n=1 Tax=Aliidiomarina sedimenti TaxID=1933879 RepID=A0ABY0C1T9_9GAMM|nr:hypothetical protein CWE12_01090 [Aliidiomarina sedimenti]
MSVSWLYYGPHSYVSPTWYSARPAVPTWNYAALELAVKKRSLLSGVLR